MEVYKTRRISFKEIIELGGWSVKVYTITKQGEFAYPEFYNNVKRHLPGWLAIENSFHSDHHGMGFLILHAGSEGIFSLINWWIGENMLNTHIFLTNPEQPDEFPLVSGDGFGPCIWELEVVNHERVAWMNHVLKQAPEPDLQAYLADVFNGDV